MGHGRRDDPRPRAGRPQRRDQPTANSVRAHSSDTVGRDGHGQEDEHVRLTHRRGQEGRSEQRGRSREDVRGQEADGQGGHFWQGAGCRNGHSSQEAGGQGNFVQPDDRQEDAVGRPSRHPLGPPPRSGPSRSTARPTLPTGSARQLRRNGGCNCVARPRRYRAAGRPGPARSGSPPTGSTKPGVARTFRRKLARSGASPHTAS